MKYQVYMIEIIIIFIILLNIYVKIPLNLIAVLSEVLSEHETHATLDNLFLYAEIDSEIPDVSKPAKVQQVLMNVNKTNSDP